MTIEEIRFKHNLSLILMYGSQVTGKIHSKSDFDIAVFRDNGQKYDMLELLLDLKIFLPPRLLKEHLWMVSLFGSLLLILE